MPIFKTGNEKHESNATFWTHCLCWSLHWNGCAKLKPLGSCAKWVAIYFFFSFFCLMLSLLYNPWASRSSSWFFTNGWGGGVFKCCLLQTSAICGHPPCLNDTIYKLGQTRIGTTHYAVYVFNTVALKNGQGHQIWYEWAAPQARLHTCRVWKTSLNQSLRKKATLWILPDQETDQLPSLNTYTRKGKNVVVNSWSIHIINNHTLFQSDQIRTWQLRCWDLAIRSKSPRAICTGRAQEWTAP